MKSRIIRKTKKNLKKVIKKYLLGKPVISLHDVRKYREFDHYELALEAYPAKKVHIDSKLPSEPPGGITYEFGPSGYVGDISSDYCTIPSTWREPDNYCHWNFSELPFLFLAFESKAHNIILPDLLIDGKMPFQKKWMELLYEKHPEKKVIRLSKTKVPKNTMIPVNHDTSTSNKAIGKCEYKYYHHGRATPYLIARVNEYKNDFDFSGITVKHGDLIYINRPNRRLQNELEVQSMVKELGFEIVTLEDLVLEEQILLFLNAKTIIGFHGAGLANLLFCNDGSTQVFEFADIDCVYPCYLDGKVISGEKATRTYFHMLSVMKNLEYHCVETIDYMLDLDAFKQELTAALNK